MCADEFSGGTYQILCGPLVRCVWRRGVWSVEFGKPRPAVLQGAVHLSLALPDRVWVGQRVEVSEQVEPGRHVLLLTLKPTKREGRE